MSFNSTIVKTYASTVVALSGVVAGTVTSAAGLVLAPNQSQNIAADSLVMNVSAAITTSTIVVATVWQVSDDGTNWRTIYALNGAAYVNVAPAGTSSLVTTAYCQPLAGFNFSKQYVRAAVLNTVATGGAGDNVTISYGWRRAFNSVPRSG
jgi:hypothetical protein